MGNGSSSNKDINTVEEYITTISEAITTTLSQQEDSTVLTQNLEVICSDNTKDIVVNEYGNCLKNRPSGEDLDTTIDECKDVFTNECTAKDVTLQATLTIDSDMATDETVQASVEANVSDELESTANQSLSPLSIDDTTKSKIKEVATEISKDYTDIVTKIIESQYQEQALILDGVAVKGISMDSANTVIASYLEDSSVYSKLLDELVDDVENSATQGVSTDIFKDILIAICVIFGIFVLVWIILLIVKKLKNVR